MAIDHFMPGLWDLKLDCRIRVWSHLLSKYFANYLNKLRSANLSSNQQLFNSKSVDSIHFIDRHLILLSRLFAVDLLGTSFVSFVVRGDSPHASATPSNYSNSLTNYLDLGVAVFRYFDWRWYLHFNIDFFIFNYQLCKIDYSVTVPLDVESMVHQIFVGRHTS